MISTYRLHGVSLDNKQESKIHGVKLQTFNKSGEVTASTYIPGIKLHEEVYSTKTKQFMTVDEYHATKKKKYLNSLR
jgi:hypothetical protein